MLCLLLLHVGAITFVVFAFVAFVWRAGLVARLNAVRVVRRVVAYLAGRDVAGDAAAVSLAADNWGQH